MSIDAAIIQHVDRSAPITHAVADQALNAISPSLVVNVGLSVSETGSASEAPSVQSEASLSAAEAGTATESPSVGAEATPSAEETGTATEAPSVITSASLSVSETVTQVTLFLDIYPGAAAAYSLRKLRLGYSGDCIRVRRSSDNAEQDIGFSDGTLDETALLNFVGSGDGFVQTWYGQSSNLRDVTQSTQSDQPKIVNAGAVITVNGDPALDFDGTQFLDTGSFVLSQPNTLISVTTLDDTTDGYRFADSYSGAGAGERQVLYTDGSDWALFGGNKIAGGGEDTNSHVHSAIFDGASSERRVDGSSVVSGDGGPNDMNGFNLGGSQNSDDPFLNGTMREAILYPYRQSDLSSIESDRQSVYL